MNLDFIKNLPPYQKLLVLGLVNILIVAMFFWFFYLPKNNEIAALRNDVAKLDSEIGINRAKVEKLDQLKRENAELERQLAEKKEQLPPEAEVASLLKQVSDLGLRIGLDFKLWRPSTKKEGAGGLYAEIPVDVEVGGGYHTTALFFDSVSKLPRIVNISNIRMGNPRVEKGRLLIQTTFMATAFAAIEPKAGEDKKKPAKGAPAKGGNPSGIE
ncbi:MAG: type 4a pilus biogenesis protein PilO [Nitrospirae bacterium]|nr:type 4a pilus biogenesis protein PilO [Nitrospirota bacterium]